MTNKSEARQRNILINKYICNYIAKRWIVNRVDENGKEVTKRQYAKDCNLATSTITKLQNPDGYNIPFATITSICSKENIVLSAFFSDFEKEFGISIIDKYLDKK
ncbi:hypothetical protein B0A67_06075 [Flavobacterium aquidurense]|uniref:hypothetical protein n=1 Tax=Flavobacterium aquidurense TaxID=362413 RepID=UPI000915B480|nr:hypothetical protein [Flavobacterium aquidurense]OXA73009.1 hypothetical protein B0A67_06075 [Flavobacterium aquidurense]SHH16652.1 hypothetical protein SAMN05444481_112115 [Flavobacterium frigidimaris]